MSSKPDFGTMTDEQYEAYWSARDQQEKKMVDDMVERARSEEPMEISADGTSFLPPMNDPQTFKLDEMEPWDSPTCNPFPVSVHDFAVAPVAIAEMHGWTITGYDLNDVFLNGPNGIARSISVSRKTGNVKALPF